jgi:hypothetical protein
VTTWPAIDAASAGRRRPSTTSAPYTQTEADLHAALEWSLAEYFEMVLIYKVQ